MGVYIPSDYRPTSALDQLLRQYDILCNHVTSEVKYCSDYVIHPRLDDIHWTDFRKLELVIERGYRAGKRAVPEIKRLLEDNKSSVSIEDRPWHNARYKKNPFVVENFPSIE